MEEKTIRYAKRILEELGIEPGEEFLERIPTGGYAQTKEYPLHGALIRVSLTERVNTLDGPIDECKVEIEFSLPEDGALAETFMNHCAAIEGTPENIGHNYCHGPRYRDYGAELRGKNTYACSPWHNTYFFVQSIRYKTGEIAEAVDNALALAKQFSAHLPELASLRYWKSTDEEVLAKAKEIVQNADLVETDVDREDRAHWLEDRKSFFKGWFYPFNDGGRGTFDTLYKPFFGAIGIEGSFEYAVSCLLLYDRDYIAKARKACRIVTEKVTRTIQY